MRRSKTFPELKPIDSPEKMRDVIRSIEQGKPQLIPIASGYIERMKNEEEDSEEYVFVISDESVDSYGTIFRLDGWELDEFNDNGIVTCQHPYLGTLDIDCFIGTGRAFKEDGKLKSTLILEKGETNEMAKKVKSKIDQKIFKKASVYAYVQQGHWGDEERGEDPDTYIYTKQTLVTWGVVGFPANKNAVIEEKSETPTDDKKELMRNTIAKATAIAASI